MHILITGGTGFIGSALCERFTQMNHYVSVLTRNPHDQVHLPKSVVLLNDLCADRGPFDVIINLAGEPLSKRRWNNVVKKTLYDSRITATQMVTNYIKQCSIKPKVLLSGSAIGFYGDSLTQVFNEESSPTHQNFTHKLCHDWEQAAVKAQNDGVRVCTLRLGIVLGKNSSVPGAPLGGALAEMITPFKLGLGATLGSGKQWMSWVHLADVVGIIDFLVHHPELSGPFNLTAPHPVTNHEFTKTLAQQVKRPAFLSMPKCVVTALFGEMAESLLLVGQNVRPDRITSAGYIFNYQNLKKTLQNIFE